MDVLNSTALDIWAAVRSGRTSAEDVVAAHLARMRVEDPRWNAFRVVRHDAAIAEARALDSDAGRQLWSDHPQAGSGHRACRLGCGGLVRDGGRMPTAARGSIGLRRPWPHSDIDRAGPSALPHGRSAAFFDGVDVLLTPVLIGSPPLAQDWHRRRWLTNVVTSSRFAPYPSVWNMAGYPAMSVPMGTRSDGLPLAVQMMGAPGSEARLLAVAAALERELPWQRHAAPAEAEPRPS